MTEPIACAEGVQSGPRHLLYVKSTKIYKYSYYRESEEGNLLFGQWLKKQTWTSVQSAGDASSMVEALPTPDPRRGYEKMPRIGHEEKEDIRIVLDEQSDPDCSEKKTCNI